MKMADVELAAHIANDIRAIDRRLQWLDKQDRDPPLPMTIQTDSVHPDDDALGYGPSLDPADASAIRKAMATAWTARRAVRLDQLRALGIDVAEYVTP